jgi:hypothetical protein
MTVMKPEFGEYVHARHFDFFISAAQEYNCHILVRKTGRASLQYCGLPGYAGKRADLKAKTAARDLPPFKLQGLVISPLIHPTACKPGALQEWGKSAHLVTVPPDGFDDRVQPRGCTTPYILQTRRHHKHYGCVAWVEHGLIVPRYVHGDYDLYAIVPAGKAFSLDSQPVRAQPMLAHMDLPQRMGLAARVARESERTAHSPTDHVSQLSLKISTTINLRIARTEPGIPGALMVNHGEQVNLGGSAVDCQPVLAFLASPRQGEYALELSDRESHEAFYASA